MKATHVFVGRPQDWCPSEEDGVQHRSHADWRLHPSTVTPRGVVPSFFVNEMEVERRARLRVGPPPKNPQRGGRWKAALERLKEIERSKMMGQSSMSGTCANEESEADADARFRAIAEAMCDAAQ